MKNFVLTIFLLASTFVFSKTVEVDSFMVEKENEISILLDNLRKSKSSGEREMHNLSLMEAIKEIAVYPSVISYNFTKLTTMSTIQSPDGEFRLFNWNIELEDLTHTHYCIMVQKGKGNKQNEFFEFKEDKITLPPSPDGILNPQNWYGALYYKIVPVKLGSKTLYTVLGYSGNNRSSRKKILDVFWFKGKHLKLGYPIFEDPENNKVLKRRVFFEYSSKATISVKYLEDIGKIVFDHLSPEAPNLVGMYEYYVPDMSYDAYFWKDGRWKYQEDILVGNSAQKSRKVYYLDENGVEKYKVVSNTWEDPTDSESPFDNGEHQIVEVENNQKPTKKKEAVKFKKKAKSNTNTTKKKSRLKKDKNPKSAVELDKKKKKK